MGLETREIPVEQLAVCERCHHAQADPNWCQKCGHRTTLPEWAVPLVAAWHAAGEASDR